MKVQMTLVANSPRNSSVSTLVLFTIILLQRGSYKFEDDRNRNEILCIIFNLIIFARIPGYDLEFGCVCNIIHQREAELLEHQICQEMSDVCIQ